MITDRPPRNTARLSKFLESDRLGILDLPQDDRLRTPAGSIAAALTTAKTTALRLACARFLVAASDFYKVSRPEVRVLAARPIRVREGGGSTEFFGDYHPKTMLIRVWMRTAVRKQVTSFGTFLSTLCHEFCHHLDSERLGFPDSPHTRGFYERAAALYHHARGTPVKRLFWAPMAGRRWRINWQRTNRGF
jgi:hypothetical protein